MRILQGVEHRTNVIAESTSFVVVSNVSVLVDGERDYITVCVSEVRIVRECALDLNRVAWELAELEDVFVVGSG